MPSDIAPRTSSLGLILDVIGVCFRYKYGLPADVNVSGHITRVIEQTDEAEVSKGS